MLNVHAEWTGKDSDLSVAASKLAFGASTVCVGCREGRGACKNIPSTVHIVFPWMCVVVPGLTPSVQL